MINKKVFYRILAVISAIFAAQWYFFGEIAAKTGGQIVIGANNMSTTWGKGAEYRQQATKILVDFQKYFTDSNHLQFDWTIGPFHLVPFYLAVIFMLLALVLFVLGFSKSTIKN